MGCRRVKFDRYLDGAFDMAETIRVGGTEGHKISQDISDSRCNIIRVDGEKIEGKGSFSRDYKLDLGRDEIHRGAKKGTF